MITPNHIAMSIVEEFLSDGVADEYFDSVPGAATTEVRTIVDGLLRSLKQRMRYL